MNDKKPNIEAESKTGLAATPTVQNYQQMLREHLAFLETQVVRMQGIVPSGQQPADIPVRSIPAPVQPPEQLPDDGRVFLDLTSSPWIRDHCPTYTVPSMPMMGELDLMASEVARKYPGKKIVGMPQVDAKSWLAFPEESQTVEVTIDEQGQDLLAVQMNVLEESGKTRLIASARIQLADRYHRVSKPVITALENTTVVADIYASGTLFHGPAFQLLTELSLGSNGASGWLDLDRNGVPAGILNPGLLDAALHTMPHDNLSCWHPDIPSDHAAYPLRIEDLVIHQAIPVTGLIRVEARFMSLTAKRFPRTQLWLYSAGTLIAEFVLMEVLMPKGALGTLPPAIRKAFLSDRRYFPIAHLSQFDVRTTRLKKAHVPASNWLPGTLEQVYQSGTADGLSERIVQSEHASRFLRLHPSRIKFSSSGQCLNLPLNRFVVSVEDAPKEVLAKGEIGALQWEQISRYWSGRSGEGRLTHDLIMSLMRKFIRRVIITDPEGFGAGIGQPVLYLSNHQTQVESFLFMAVLTALGQIPVGMLSGRDEVSPWITQLHALAQAEMGPDSLSPMWTVDEADPTDVHRLLNSLGSTLKDHPGSFLKHVDGDCQKQAGQPVRNISPVLIDFAVNNNVPIVPVRFSGGLPAERSGNEFDFPFGYGKQDYFLGSAISPDGLAGLSIDDSVNKVLMEINSLGSVGEMDEPGSADNEFSDQISTRRNQVPQVIIAGLKSVSETDTRTRELLKTTVSGLPETGEFSRTELLFLELLGIT